MDIHVRLAGVQLGPYSARQVRDYLTEGLLSATDQAKEVGTDNWISVAEMLAKAGPELLAEPVPAEAAPAGSVFVPEPEPAPVAVEEPEPEPEPEPVPEEEAEEEAPRRAPVAGPGVTHLPSRQKDPGKDSGKVSLSPVVEALSKKTILMGPTAPTVPTSSSGRTGYSTMTTSPMSKTPPTPPSKNLTQTGGKIGTAQTAPLPTKSIKPMAKIPLPSPPRTTHVRDPGEGITAHPTQEKQPRQSLLQSLTAKTVPMRTNAAPPLPAAPSGTIPVTAPLPSRSTMKVPEPTRPPSVVDDITKKLGKTVKPDAGPKTDAASKSNAASTKPAEEVETVKISLKKISRDEKPAETKTPETKKEPAEEKVKAPRTRRLISPVYILLPLLALIIYYIWSPYHTAAQLQTALTDGDSKELATVIDFDAVQNSLKDQIKTQLATTPPGATESAMSDARDMLNKSIDLFVTPAGISGLVSKSGKFTEQDLAQTVSFSTASKIFAGFNSPVKKTGFSGLTSFAVERDATKLGLGLKGANWHVKSIELHPDLLKDASSNDASPFLTPVVDTYMERGDALMKKGDTASTNAAIAAYTEVLGIAPKSSVAYNARGVARQARNDLDGAMKDYSQALSIDPQLAVAYEGRGNVKTAKNDLDGAVADYTKALSIDPTLAPAYDGRGNAKTAKDELEGAIADYTLAIKYDPTYASAFSDRGFARQANGNLDGAIEDYTTALKLKPKTAVAYYNRGLARQSQGNLEAAIVDYDRALAFDPKIAGAYYNRGNAKSATHDVDGAIADFTQAIALNPKIALAYCNRGVARQAKGDLDGAIADYTQALAIDPKIAIAYYNRGRIKQIKNDPDGAIADSSQAIDLDPKNPQAYFNRGFAKFSKGNLDGAQDDLKQFVDGSPHDTNADHARLYLWLIGKAQGTKPDADIALSDALENSWNAAPDDFTTKTANYLLGKLSEADYLAAAASPDAKKDADQHCEAYYFAGIKRIFMGDKVTATDYFHKSIATGLTDSPEYLLSQTEIRVLEPSTPPEPPKAP